MTLTTRIDVMDPLPVADVAKECRRLLGAGPEIPYGPWHSWATEPSRCIEGHKPGMGLPALFWVEYRPDGPMPKLYDDDPEPPEAIRIHFDTAYGYQAENGAGCADLHAWLIRELCSWLSERGVIYRWQDEFRGEWHADLDALPLLGDASRGQLAR